MASTQQSISSPPTPPTSPTGSPVESSDSTTSFLWRPIASLFTSRTSETAIPSITISRSSPPTSPSNSTYSTITTATTVSSSAITWLASLASVFGTRELKGSILVEIEFQPPGPDSRFLKRQFHASDNLKDRSLEIQEKIVELLEESDNTYENAPASENGHAAHSNSAMDVTIQYTSNHHSGMRTEEGDYVMYGHLAIPASVHRHLLSLGVTPAQIEESIEAHHSNPDRAIEWLLEGKRESQRDAQLLSVRSLVMDAQPPQDIQLTEFPSFINSMTKLQRLELKNHMLTNFPAHIIFGLPLLEHLSLRSTGLKSFLDFPEPRTSMIGTSSYYSANGNSKYVSPPYGVPMMIRSSSNLSSNDVSHQESWRFEDLSTLVSTRGTPKLRYLDLSSNLLVNIPTHISILANLTYLDISRNRLKALPEELTSMPIQTLLLEENQVYDMPAANSISTVAPLLYTNLTSLNLVANNIRPSILSLNPRTLLGNLALYRNIQTLELAHNVLAPLPSSLLQLAPTITSLNLSHLNLRQLVPTEIKSFHNLEILDLSFNGLSKLPIELCTLGRINSLDISHNELTALPQGLPGLRNNMKRFYLADNLLSTLPASFVTLIHLTDLKLANNKLTDSSLELLTSLTALERLDLSGNLFTHFPTSLSSLQKLTYISLSRNPLTSVDALPYFGQLEEIELNEVPQLKSLPKLDLKSLRRLHAAHIVITMISEQDSPEESENVSFEVSRSAPGLRRQKRHSRRVEVEVDVPDPEMFEAEQLVIWVRTYPHALILGGLTQLCLDPRWHFKLLKADLVRELSQLMLQMELPSQPMAQTLLAIKTLCKNTVNHRLIGQDKQIIQCLGDILWSNMEQQSKARRKNGRSSLSASCLLLRLALDSLTYLSFDPELRGIIYSVTPSNGTKLIDSTTLGSSPPTESSNTIHDGNREIIVIDDDDESVGPSMDVESGSPPQSRTSHRSDDMNAPFLPELVARFAQDEDIQIAARAKRCMNGLGVMQRPKRGLRILSIDGGGTRGFIVLHMLALLERLTGKRINEVVDLIVGTSTGGLITGLAAWSPISMEEAKPYYRIMCKTIFTPKGQTPVPPSGTVRTNGPPPVPPLFSMDLEEEESWIARVHSGNDLLSSSFGGSFGDLRNSGVSDQPQEPDVHSDASMDIPTADANGTANAPVDPSTSKESRWLSAAPWQRLTGIISMLQTKSYYETAPLEDVLKEMAGIDVSMLDTATFSDCKFAVCCTRANVFPPQPYMLRNYHHPFTSPFKDTLEGSASFRVWESIRATCAAPGYFDPLVKEDLHLVDGAMIYNNPIALALTEAKALWPDSEIDCIISCGTGTRPPQPIDVTMGSLLSDVVDSATETEKTALLAQVGLPARIYHRLQPMDPIFDFPIDECRHERFDEMEKFMEEWLQTNEEKFKRIAEMLLE